MNVQEQTTYQTDHPFKPDLYVGEIYEKTTDLASGRERSESKLSTDSYWTGRYVSVAHLDQDGRIIRIRHLAVTGLEDELSAFDYEQAPASPGWMVGMWDKNELRKTLRDELHDVFPSAAQFRENGARWEALVFVSGGSYTLTFRPGKEQTPEERLHLQVCAFKQESKQAFEDGTYEDEEEVLQTRIEEATLREGLEELKSNIPDDMP